jgi:hypothetical protein
MYSHYLFNVHELRRLCPQSCICDAAIIKSLGSLASATADEVQKALTGGEGFIATQPIAYYFMIGELLLQTCIGGSDCNWHTSIPEYHVCLRCC